MRMYQLFFVQRSPYIQSVATLAISEMLVIQQVAAISVTAFWKTDKIVTKILAKILRLCYITIEKQSITNPRTVSTALKLTGLFF